MTCKENIHHAHEFGLSKHFNGSKSSGAKLTPDQVRYIRANYIPYDREFGATALGKKFGVKNDTILDIIHYRTYKDVE